MSGAISRRLSPGGAHLVAGHRRIERRLVVEGHARHDHDVVAGVVLRDLLDFGRAQSGHLRDQRQVLGAVARQESWPAHRRRRLGA